MSVGRSPMPHWRLRPPTSLTCHYRSWSGERRSMRQSRRSAAELCPPRPRRADRRTVGRAVTLADLSRSETLEAARSRLAEILQALDRAEVSLPVVIGDLEGVKATLYGEMVASAVTPAPAPVLPQAEEREFLTVQEVAAVLKQNDEFVRDHAENFGGSARRISARKVVFDRNRFNRWLDGRGGAS